MNLVRIFRILWAWRLLVATATLCAALGAAYVVATFPPRYEATSKVELAIIKPDPVTGFHVGSRNVAAYLTSQMQVIRDYQVAVLAAGQLGWLDAPELQLAYAEGGSASGVDFDHWVAGRITGGLIVNAMADSNVLVIRFRAPSPETARAAADAVRNAYIDTTLATARASAAANAAAQARQAEVARVKLAELAVRRTAMERETGIVLQGATSDMDTARLDALASSLPSMKPVAVGGSSSATALKLSEADSALAVATKALGPNHPTLEALRQRRAAAAAELEHERSGANSLVEAMSNQQRIDAGNVTRQVEKVIGQRKDLTRIRMLQDEIATWQARYDSFSLGEQQQMQLANLATTAPRPMGITEAPTKPIFPNIPLIMGGATSLGAVIGMLLAVLSELLGRRVRVARDLKPISTGPAFASIPQVRMPVVADDSPRKVRGPKAPRGKWKLARQ
ncbi:MAG: gumC [Phenylobacterium sp.]|nr:gumC [Phenylobacterium sp.]